MEARKKKTDGWKRKKIEPTCENILKKKRKDKAHSGAQPRKRTPTEKT